MPDSSSPRWLTIAQAAALIGCSRSSVQRRIADGRLPVLRLGRVVRISADTLQGHGR